jgi:hypothetical protein
MWHQFTIVVTMSPFHDLGSLSLWNVLYYAFLDSPLSFPTFILYAYFPIKRIQENVNQIQLNYSFGSTVGTFYDHEHRTERYDALLSFNGHFLFVYIQLH